MPSQRTRNWTHKNLKHMVCRLILQLWSFGSREGTRQSTFHTSFSLQECNAAHHIIANDSISGRVPFVTSTMPYCHFHSHAQALPNPTLNSQVGIQGPIKEKATLFIQSLIRRQKQSLSVFGNCCVVSWDTLNLYNSYSQFEQEKKIV